MGKKRRGGKASKRGNNSAAANSDGGGLQRTSTGIRYKDGTYVGELKGRKPHGKGRVAYGNGDVYDGEWNNGQKHGRGIGSYPHIGVYEGEWENNMQHGKGSFAFKDDGSVYVGEFANGQMHGSGTRTWPTGNVYEGQWANGTAHGEGAHTLSTGEIYQGIWVDGKLVEEDVMDRCPPDNGLTSESSSLCNADHRNGDNSASSNSKARNSDGSGLLQHTVKTICYDDGTTYEGEVKDGTRHGRGVYGFNNGDVYDGEWKDDKRHGSGIYYYLDGSVYEGEYANGLEHGNGVLKGTSSNGMDICYNGEFKNGKSHGKGVSRVAGDIYDGEWKEGKRHGTGTMTKVNGLVYDGEWVEGAQHGWGTKTWGNGNVYEGQFEHGRRHGKGTMKYPSGEILEGSWMHGEFDQCPPGASAVGETSLLNVDTRNDDIAPDANRELLSGRKLRSIRSQQQRLQTTRKTCEICGVDDYRYKLWVCSGCNLALYCSEACQKAARGSHQRICDIISVLPPRDADRLVLEFDKGKVVDFDAGLRYATKYMSNLKHLTLNIQLTSNDDGTAKLSPERLSSLLKLKKGALDSVFWLSNCYFGMATTAFPNNDCVWKELHGLKQLRLESIGFDDVRCIHDIIRQQRDTLEVLCLPHLQIDWHKAKCRRTIAQAVGSCKHFVKLELTGCVLMDADLKGMLHDLPNLCILDLSRDTDSSYEFTDNTCGLIARKCPGLQELNLDNHNHITVRGIRKIFDGCSHLMSFYTSSLKLSCEDLQKLLDIAPQMMYLSLVGSDFSAGELDELIEATGGTVVFQLRADGMLEPGSVSAKTREKYECQMKILDDVWDRQEDPKVSNEWEILLEG